MSYLSVICTHEELN
jgi:hypothetical protein